MKVNKILMILIVLIILISVADPVFASDKSIVELAREWLTIGKEGTVFNTNPNVSGFENIAGLLLGIGIFVAVIVGIVLGIKFMISSPEGKAQVSKLLTPFIIGTLLIVGALTIWKISISILDI